MKPSEMTNEQLDEAVALAQGWWKYTNRYMGQHADGHDVYEDWWTSNEITKENKNHLILMGVDDYHPTADNVEGRSQCFELMVKFGLRVFIDDETVAADYSGDNEVINSDPQRAICEKVVLSIRGEGDE